MTGKKLSIILDVALGIGLFTHIAVGWMDERRLFCASSDRFRPWSGGGGY